MAIPMGGEEEQREVVSSCLPSLFDGWIIYYVFFAADSSGRFLFIPCTERIGGVVTGSF